MRLSMLAEKARGGKNAGIDPLSIIVENAIHPYTGSLYYFVRQMLKADQDKLYAARQSLKPGS